MTEQASTQLRCIECERPVSPERWRVVRADDPREDESPELVVYCATSSEREFGV